MKFKILAIVLFTAMPLMAQSDFSAGMGIDFVSSKLNDYINTYCSTGEKLSDFSSGVHFYAEGGYTLKTHIHLSAEYAYCIYSKSVNNSLGNYEYSSVIHKPSLIASYLIEGTGYRFKFGGGGGPRFWTMDEKYPGFVQITKFKSTGFGFLLKADGNTAIGSNLYADISGVLSYDFAGDIEASGNQNANLFYNLKNADADSFSAGIRLGLTYTF